jgi:hypothetical protein
MKCRNVKERSSAAVQLGEQQQGQQDRLEHGHHERGRRDSRGSGHAVEHVGHHLGGRVQAPVTSALHGVVELGVVEGGQLDLGRQVHQADFHHAVHLRAQPRLSPARGGLQGKAKPVSTPEARFSPMVATVSRRLASQPSRIAWLTSPGSCRAIAPKPVSASRRS